VTDDLRSAKVHVSVLGDDEQIASTLKALEEAKGYLRHELGTRTELRFVPELAFLSDRTAEQSARISALLREAREREGQA
jgi:ribosome-binding factor A